MNGIPQPYPNGTRLLVENRVVVVTDHAPHAEDWRYTGHPVDTTGREVHFSHHQAGPVPPSMLPPSARDLFDERTQDDLHVVVEEVPLTSAAADALRALVLWYHGNLSLDELRGNALQYLEQGA